MKPAKTFPPLIPRLCSNFLPFFAACALLLVASGLNVSRGTSTVVQNWQNRLVHHVLIALPQPAEKDKDGSQKEALLQLLRNTPQAHDIKIMNDDEIRHLMAHWGTAWSEPLPLIVRIVYNGDKTSLERLTNQQFPQAVIIFPPDIMQWLPAVIKPLQLASNVVAFFLVLTGETIFILSFILSLSHGWQKHFTAIKVLFHSGCSERLFWHSVRRQTGWRCLIGGYAGVIIMVPFLNIMTSILQPVLHIHTQLENGGALFFHDPFGPILTIILLLWPLLNCLIGWGMAACFFRHPSRHFYA